MKKLLVNADDRRRKMPGLVRVAEKGLFGRQETRVQQSLLYTVATLTSSLSQHRFYYFILCTGSSELCAAATTTKVTVNSADSDDPTVVSVIKSCACRSEAMFGKRK